MNKGNIPGFYFDEEKKKYFKIQADHLVPQRAKYAKGQVRQDERIAKKRKIERKNESSRLKQTVRRCLVLLHPLVGGTGLLREHGGSQADASDRALVSEWRPEKVLATQTTAHYLPKSQQMLRGVRCSAHGDSVLRISKWDWNTAQAVQSPHLGPGDRDEAGFTYPVKHIATTRQGDVPRMLICANDGKTAGTIHTGPIISDYSPSHRLDLTGQSYPELAAFQHSTGEAVVLSRSRLYVINTDYNVSNRLKIDTAAWAGPPRDQMIDHEFGPCIDWLDPHTVAFNINGESYYKTTLWDTRTAKGVSVRFNLRSRTTGLLIPENTTPTGGHQLVVSTNHNINVYDTRMSHSASKPDQALLSIPHVHQGHMQQHATNGSLVAAVDRNNLVQIYSLKTGRSLRALEVPYKVMGARSSIGDLMWYDDEKHGWCLQACGQAGIVRWVWGGADDGILSPVQEQGLVVR